MLNLSDMWFNIRCKSLSTIYTLGGIKMSFINYIKDCIEFAKRFPLRNGDNKRIWFRNVLYVNAQPKYWHGWIISKLL